MAEIDARYDPGRQKAKDGTSPEAHPPIRGSRYLLLVKSVELVGWALGELEREITQARGHPRARPRAASGPIRYRKAALKIRRLVAGHDVFSWAPDILEGLENLEPTSFPAALGQVRPAPRDRGHAGVASPGIPPPARVKPSR